MVNMDYKMWCKPSGNFRPSRRLLRSLLPENFYRDKKVSLTADVRQSEGDGTTAGKAATEEEVADDLRNMANVLDVGDDAITIRRLRRLAKHLSSEVIQFKRQYITCVFVLSCVNVLNDEIAIAS